MLVHLAGELAGDLDRPDLRLEGAREGPLDQAGQLATPGCAARSLAPSIADSPRRSARRRSRRRPGRVGSSQLQGGRERCWWRTRGRRPRPSRPPCRAQVAAAHEPREDRRGDRPDARSAGSCRTVKTPRCASAASPSAASGVASSEPPGAERARRPRARGSAAARPATAGKRAERAAEGERRAATTRAGRAQQQQRDGQDGERRAAQRRARTSYVGEQDGAARRPSPRASRRAAAAGSSGEGDARPRPATGRRVCSSQPATPPAIAAAPAACSDARPCRAGCGRAPRPGGGRRRRPRRRPRSAPARARRRGRRASRAGRAATCSARVDRRDELRPAGRGGAWPGSGPACRACAAVAAGVAPRTGLTPGERLVEDERERVEVGAVVDALARRLLRGHVGERPDDVAGDASAGRRPASIATPKSASLAAPRQVRGRSGTRMFCRLDVAVDDAALVRVQRARRTARGRRAGRRGRSAPRPCSSWASVRPSTSSETR